MLITCTCTFTNQRPWTNSANKQRSREPWHKVLHNSATELGYYRDGLRGSGVNCWCPATDAEQAMLKATPSVSLMPQNVGTKVVSEIMTSEITTCTYSAVPSPITQNGVLLHTVCEALFITCRVTAPIVVELYCFPRVEAAGSAILFTSIVLLCRPVGRSGVQSGIQASTSTSTTSSNNLRF